MIDDDDQLRRQLRAVAGTEPDFIAAQTAVGARVARVRRRRAAAVSSASMIAAVMLIGAYALNLGGDPAQRVTSAAVPATEDFVSTTPDITLESASTTASASAPLESTSSVAALDTDSSIETAASVQTNSVSGPLGGAALPAPVWAPTTTDGDTDSDADADSHIDSDDDTAISVATTSTAAPAAPGTPAATSDFASAGGSIRVRLQDGVLMLLAVNPASGFNAEVSDATATRIEVKFESATTHTSIEVNLVGGAMIPHVETIGSDSDGSSGTSESGTGGGGEYFDD